MKLKILSLVLLFSFAMVHSQQWMRSLPIAQNLAMAQNKMVLMVWEETTNYPYPIWVNDSKGRVFFIRNLFTNEDISPVIWEYFVPVIVSENEYEQMFLKIKGKRSQSYMDKFNDDSIKIMDINGNILNTAYSYYDYENITRIINKYGLSTEFLASELKSYHNMPDFYSAYFLSSKYLEYALYLDTAVRKEIIGLAEIYAEDAERFIEKSKGDDPAVLYQRLELLDAYKALINERPRSSVRTLKRIEKDGLLETNESMYTFLSYTVNVILDRQDKAKLLEKQISSINLRKAQKLISLNR